MPVLRKLFFVDSSVSYGGEYGLWLLVAAKNQKEVRALFKKAVKRTGMIGKICTSKKHTIIEHVGQALPKQRTEIIREQLINNH